MPSANRIRSGRFGGRAAACHYGSFFFAPTHRALLRKSNAQNVISFNVELTIKVPPKSCFAFLVYGHGGSIQVGIFSGRQYYHRHPFVIAVGTCLYLFGLQTCQKANITHYCHPFTNVSSALVSFRWIAASVQKLCVLICALNVADSPTRVAPCIRSRTHLD